MHSNKKLQDKTFATTAGGKKGKNFRVKILALWYITEQCILTRKKRSFLYNYPWGHPYVIAHKMMLECMHIIKSHESIERPVLMNLYKYYYVALQIINNFYE